MPKTGFIMTEIGVPLSDALTRASRQRNKSKSRILREALFKELAEELLDNQRLEANIIRR